MGATMTNLLVLVEEIKAELQSSDDYRLKAAKKMAEARELVDKVPKAKRLKWKAFAMHHFDLSWSEVKKLVAIGSSEDPKAAMADHREKTRISAAKSRKSKQKNGSDVGAPEKAGANGDEDGPEPDGEKDPPELGTIEQQRDRIIHSYKAESDDARKSFRKWLDDEDGYE